MNGRDEFSLCVTGTFFFLVNRQGMSSQNGASKRVKVMDDLYWGEHNTFAFLFYCLYFHFGITLGFNLFCSIPMPNEVDAYLVYYCIMRNGTSTFSKCYLDQIIIKHNFEEFPLYI